MDKIRGEEGWISLGPWGGHGGVYSTYKPDGPIMQITIWHGDVIDSILFESKSRNGVIIGRSVKIGGPYGTASAKSKISGEEGWISLGPWGGKAGEYSTYKPDESIMQITIRYGEVINSILFESKSRDGVVIGSSVKIGGMGGDQSEKFCIDNSVEQLSSISLTYGDYEEQVAIVSLCFITNLKTYGPFGTRSGASSRYIPLKWEVVVGFHGRGGYYVTAIGIFVAPKVNTLSSSERKFDSLLSVQDPNYAPTQLKQRIIREEGWISLGPWGGKCGVYSIYKPDGHLMQITVCHGDFIDSILFESKSHDGIIIERSVKIGGTGGGAFAKFCIDSSVERLTSISLTYGYINAFYVDVVLTSLCFITNVKKYGPFGLGGGHSMSIPIEGGVITRFHGRGGIFVNAIGIFVAPKVDSFPNSGKNINSLHSIQDPDSVPTQLKGKINGKEGWISIGPWGGQNCVYSAYKSDGL